jgi:hypothetical protein
LFGLKNAGKLSKDKLDLHLAGDGYKEDAIVPGIYKHETNDIVFIVVVDDFSVLCATLACKQHFLDTLKRGKYTITVDEEGKKFLGMTVHRFPDRVELSLDGYVDKLLKRFEHLGIMPCDSPAIYHAPEYGSTKPQLVREDTSGDLSDSEVTELQAIIGAVLYYGRAVDHTVRTAVSIMAHDLAARKQSMYGKARRLLGYLKKFPDNRLVFRKSDMVFGMHVDASYLNASKAGSRVGAHGSWGNNDGSLINGATSIVCGVLDVVVGSILEAEYSACFMGGKQAVWMRQIGRALGCPQKGPTILRCDNSCAVGLANDEIKFSQSKAIDMRWHWIRCRVRQGQFKIIWIPSHDNLADFFTKAIPVHEHLTNMRRLVRSRESNPQRAARSAAWRFKQVRSA